MIRNRIWFVDQATGLSEKSYKNKRKNENKEFSPNKEDVDVLENVNKKQAELEIKLPQPPPIVRIDSCEVFYIVFWLIQKFSQTTSILNITKL